MAYQLKFADTELMTFELSRRALEGFSCKILQINAAHRHLLPLGMVADDAGLFAWLKSRVIPQNREFVDKILSVYGLSHQDVPGIISICKGLSLNDLYWIVEEGFEGRFQDYNLFDNPFDKALSLIAYTGYGSVKPSGFSSSPEFTTNGMLRKGWRRIGGKIKLYKGGSSGAANTGNEPYSEFYASQIAAAMGVNHVPYTLAKWKGDLCSVCELFTDRDHAFVPMWRFCNTKSLKELADYVKALGDDYFADFCDLMIFDAVIYNTDRHLNNFGLMVSNRDNQPIGFAPIFDNGLSLFNFAMADDFENLERYAQTRLTAFGTSFDEVAEAFMTARQKAQLHRLSEFKFTRHPRYNLPPGRLRALERFLRHRITALLGC